MSVLKKCTESKNKTKIVEIVDLRELLRRADVNMTNKEIEELEDFIIKQHKKITNNLS